MNVIARYGDFVHEFAPGGRNRPSGTACGKGWPAGSRFGKRQMITTDQPVSCRGCQTAPSPAPAISAPVGTARGTYRQHKLTPGIVFRYYGHGADTPAAEGFRAVASIDGSYVNVTTPEGTTLATFGKSVKFWAVFDPSDPQPTD